MLRDDIVLAMRRIAFISDVHANLETLEAVLRDVDAQKPDLLVCLGDTINYGPSTRHILSWATRTRLRC